jgi:hypothetical protein
MLTGKRTHDSGPHVDAVPLPAPVARLVAEHVVDEVQARAVLDALGSGGASAEQATATEPTRSLTARLAEIGAYLGAGLVVAAGIVVVAQQWTDMSYGVRVGVMAGVALVLLLAAAGLVRFRSDRAWHAIDNGDTLRRLSGALFAFGALASYGTVMVALLSEQAAVTDVEAGRASILGALVALAILFVARWQADTPLGEIAVFGFSTTAYVGVIQVSANDRTVIIQWSLLALGVAWAMVGTFTTVMRHQVLITSLGLLEAFFAAATISEVAWSHRLALAVLIALSLSVYLIRPSWPYITTATLAAVVLTVTWVGEAVGPAVALLAAGLVLLLVAGGVLVLRRRRTVTPLPTTGA